MKQRTIALILLALSVILAVTALAVGIWRFSGDRPDAAEPEAEADILTTTTPKPTVTPRGSVPAWTGPAVAAQDAPIPADYFDDAAFLGNSLVSDLDMFDYSGLLTNADFYVQDGLTIQSCADQVSKMADTVYGKVYVGLGMNELRTAHDTLRQAFNNLIDRLEENNPGCVIYLMSVSPVSAYKSSSDSSHTLELVLSFNELLQEIATERRVWYLDIYTGLANEEGYLPSEVTNDGIHFTPGHYDSWYEYLREHYVPIEKLA